MGSMGRLGRYLQPVAVAVMVVALFTLCGATSVSAAPSPAFATPGTFSCKAASAANKVSPPPPIWKLSGRAPSADEVATANAIKPPCPAGQVPSPMAHGAATPDLTPTYASPINGELTATSQLGTASEPHTVSQARRGESCKAGGCYWYAYNDVQKEAIGMEYETNISQPQVSGFSEAHSIDQLAVGAGTEGDQYTIEAGWDVDPMAGWGSPEKPHFFVVVNPDNYGPESCYVGIEEKCTSFVPAAEAKIAPGVTTLEPSTTKFRIGVEYTRGNWWIWAGTQWIGYVRKSAWGGNFTKGTSEANYGEVYDNESKPTSQMGDGQFGSSSGATSMTQSFVLLTENKGETAGYHGEVTNSSLYSIGDINSDKTEWHFGGPGDDPVPTVTTEPASEVEETSAILHGDVDPNYGETHYYFQYGTTSSYGSSTPEVDVGSGGSPVPVSATITNLRPGTPYHYRIVASNGDGTSYGGDRTFRTRTHPVLNYISSSNVVTSCVESENGGATNCSDSGFWQPAASPDLSTVPLANGNLMLNYISSSNVVTSCVESENGGATNCTDSGFWQPAASPDLSTVLLANGNLMLNYISSSNVVTSCVESENGGATNCTDSGFWQPAASPDLSTVLLANGNLMLNYISSSNVVTSCVESENGGATNCTDSGFWQPAASPDLSTVLLANGNLMLNYISSSNVVTSCVESENGGATNCSDSGFWQPARSPSLSTVTLVSGNAMLNYISSNNVVTSCLESENGGATNCTDSGFWQPAIKPNLSTVALESNGHLMLNYISSTNVVVSCAESESGGATNCTDSGFWQPAASPDLSTTALGAGGAAAANQPESWPTEESEITGSRNTVRDPESEDEWVFAPAANGAINEWVWTPSTGWSLSTLSGGAAIAPGTVPQVVRNPRTGSMAVYYNANNGQIWNYNTQQAGGTSGWSSYALSGGGAAAAANASPSVVYNPATGFTAVYYVGPNGRMWNYNWTLQNSWSAYELSGGGAAAAANASPSVVYNPATGFTAVYYVASNGRMWSYNWTLQNSWSAYELSGGGAAAAANASPSVVYNPATGFTAVYYVGPNGRMWNYNWTLQNSWSAYELSGGGAAAAANASPSVVYNPATGFTAVYYVGPNGRMWNYNWTLQNSWSAYELSGGGAAAAANASPSVVYNPATGFTAVYYVASNGQMWNYNWTLQTSWTASALPDLPINIGKPSLSTTMPSQNVPLLTTNGSWTNNPTSYVYQWERCNASGAECSSIAGETSSSYTPVEADLEHTLVMTVTATNNEGSTPASSSPTSVVRRMGQIAEHTLPTGSKPEGIAAGPDGKVWFAEYGTGEIGQIGVTMEGLTEFPVVSGKASGIVTGPDGNLWFTNCQKSKIGQMTTGGIVTHEYALPTGSKPKVIVAGPNGSLWFSDYGTDAIGRITTAGAIEEYKLPDESRRKE